MSENIEPVTITVPEEQLADLKDRLATIRWPEGATVSDTSQGPVLDKLRALTDHWRTDYDWRRVETELNTWGLHRTTIDGLDIDFLHIRSPEPDAVPLILTHGWPGSILEFRKVIGPLSDPSAHGGNPRDAFHLVIPVLPDSRPSRPRSAGAFPGSPRRGSYSWTASDTTVGAPRAATWAARSPTRSPSSNPPASSART